MTNERKKKELGYGDDSLEEAEDYLENCRTHLKTVMKPAEKAADDLKKDTATDKVRLQGTKETKAPDLKPYTESANAKDRHELSKLIAEAVRNGKTWKIRRCSEELEAKGYRYTFLTIPSESAPVVKNNNKLVLDEDIQEVPISAEQAKQDAEETANSTDDFVTPDDTPAGGTDEEPLTAMDVLKSKLDVRGEDGKIFIAIKGTMDVEDACVLSFDANEDEFGAVVAEFPVEDESAEDTEPKADDTESENKTNTDELDEASSAEKKAFKNGGQDYADYVDGKALARVKDPAERAMLLHQMRMERKGHTMSDRPSTSDTLARKTRQADNAFQKKQTKMAKSMSADEELLNENAKIELDDLQLFKPWGGAKGVWKLIVDQDKLSALDEVLERFYPDGLPASKLNDILWFEQDWLLGELDIDPTDVAKASDDDVIDVEAEVTDIDAEGDTDDKE